MKFSHNWLSTYFDAPLPTPEVLAEKITFHSSEVEELLKVGDDTALDVKVLPDKSSWLMSHRGLAKEVSVILDLPMKKDDFVEEISFPKSNGAIKIAIETKACNFYGATLIHGVKVGPSPTWLKSRLETVGQRSINNIVDATNYVMFELGQPLHAFDADILNKGEKPSIVVRQAKTGEKFTTLSHEECELTENDTVITNGDTGEVLALAGVKGGLEAGVTESTTNILLESAHFDRVAVRKTSRKYKLPTDAAKRYENGLSRKVAPVGLKAVAELIVEIAGGTLVDTNLCGNSEEKRGKVSVRIEKVNKVLGVSLKGEEVLEIMKRFGYRSELIDGLLTTYPSFERDDLVIADDLIEEIGRIYGLDKIHSIVPDKVPLKEYNQRHFYAELIREVLLGIGFSEVYTSSFTNKDLVKLENSLATDKGYLRSSLVKNITEARMQNIPHRDLLGLDSIKIFEIGTVFLPESEEFRVALAVQTGTTYKTKVDEPLLLEAVVSIEKACGVKIKALTNHEGVLEFSLEEMLTTVVPTDTYTSNTKTTDIVYKTFSQYPASSRDIAMWVKEAVDLNVVLALLKENASPLCARITHLDTFTKEGRISLAFRLVFQAIDKTLTDEEVQKCMDNVYEAASKAGFETR
jgi:phenylalanyl-tRNA synthetase beta chain